MAGGALIALLASQAIPAVVKGIAAARQNRRGRELEQTPLPEYNVPSGVNNALAAAQMAANNPDLYAQNLAQTNIQANQAQAQRAAMQSGAGPNATLAAIGAINQGANNASENLAMQNQAQRNFALRNLMGQQNLQGQYQDMAFNWNQAQPYLQAQQAAQDLLYSARGNVDSALGDISRAGITGYQANTMGELSNTMRELFPLASGDSNSNANLAALFSSAVQGIGQTSATTPAVHGAMQGVNQQAQRMAQAATLEAMLAGMQRTGQRMRFN